MTLEDKILTGYAYTIMPHPNFQKKKPTDRSVNVMTGSGGVLQYIKACKDAGLDNDELIGSSIFVSLEGHGLVCINNLTITKKQSTMSWESPENKGQVALTPEQFGTIRAKFLCHSVQMPSNAEAPQTVQMYAVYTGSEENKVFSTYTPAASLSISINQGTPAFGKFQQGEEYYLDFTKAPKP